jgi:hypothetical protein
VVDWACGWLGVTYGGEKSKLMKLSIDTILNKNGTIQIYYEKSAVSNQTKEEIVIKGNEYGFFNLSTLIIYHLSQLSNSIKIHELTFVKTNLNFEIIIDDNYFEYPEGFIRQDGEKFYWTITEDNLSILATEIQSLAFFNNELHLDNEGKQEGLSIYCVIG